MDLLDDATALASDLVDLRHRLHAWPEIGLHLPRTQETVLEELAGLGLEISTGTACTSVTAVLRGTAYQETPGAASADSAASGSSTRPVVLLRGDMDALPVLEGVDVPYRSRVDGVMHACGHDMHTAMLVGAARLLAAHRDTLNGDVVFMFQPGEEGYDGAAVMIDEGVLEAAGPIADSAFAVHVMSGQRRGAVVSRSGPLMAASDGLFVTVRGRGGHGSSPHLCQDPVPAACQMVLALHTVVSRTVDTFTPAVLTVGLLQAGTRRNIIPETVTFEATVRTFDPAVRTLIAATAERVCQGVALAHGVEVEVSYVEEYPVTVNDAAAVDYALDLATELFGPDRIGRLADPIGGSEDFSRVTSRVPAAMLFLGACLEGRNLATAPSNHSPQAAFDDSVLAEGAALLASLATGRL